MSLSGHPPIRSAPKRLLRGGTHWRMRGVESSSFLEIADDNKSRCAASDAAFTRRSDTGWRVRCRSARHDVSVPDVRPIHAPGNCRRVDRRGGSPSGCWSVCAWVAAALLHSVFCRRCLLRCKPQAQVSARKLFRLRAVLWDCCVSGYEPCSAAAQRISRDGAIYVSRSGSGAAGAHVSNWPAHLDELANAFKVRTADSNGIATRGR
jgi:hypothetical protein